MKTAEKPILYIRKTADQLKTGQSVHIPKSGKSHWKVINPAHRMGIHLKRRGKSIWISDSYTVYLPLNQDPILSTL